ncbi:type IV pilin [Vibrio ponticus]|uniref:Type II secretion system protein H n=1 Tax=Vibrio ponticus TaxID=265668 RepID=A0ABX3FC51_9VIBR|nr:GspH/FimT family pseudopilin [Vibrio ponticus]OLQ87214.1 type IV pilin [Vibrio ponticus]
MSRGFNLLELTITLVFLSVMLGLAKPSYQALLNRVKMKRLASELSGFVIQAKSEAVLRNQRLYAHFSFSAASLQDNGDWYIQLTDSSAAGGERVLYLSGEGFLGLAVTHNYGLGYLSFDGVRGRPTGGSIEFFPVTNTNERLKAVIANPPGRIRVCGVNGALYGYAQCH